MTEIMHVSLSPNGKRIEFDLTYDADFIADRNTRTVLERNECEPEVVELMARVLQPGDLAVDGGANIGVFSIIMSKLVGPSGRVLAFEPGSNNFNKLESNIKLNKLTNIEINRSPLWDEVSQLKFYLAHDSGNNTLYPHHDTLGSYFVTATTLALHCRRHVPKLLKLDLEGAELHALKGYNSILKTVPYVVCELNDVALRRLGSSQEELRNYMQLQPFHAFILHPDGSLPTLIPFQTELRSSKANLNILFSSVASVAKAWPEIELR